MFAFKGKSLLSNQQIFQWKSVPECSELLKCLRTLTSSSQNSQPKLETVKLAYTSYESTEPLSADSTPIIILHGLLGSKSNWNTLSKSIYNKTKRKVVNVDARNHGASPFSDNLTYPHMTADVRALMEDLQIEKASFIGHSMGGRTAINLALNYPDAVESLLVIDISPIGIGNDFMTISKVVDALLTVELEPKTTLSKARILADQQLATSITDTVLRQFLLTQLYEDENGNYKWRSNVDVIKRNLEHNLMKFPLDKNSRYHGPVLFIAGTRSDFVRPEDHDGIKMLFPKVKFQFMESGHWPHAEKPNEFLEIATKFLTTTPK